MSKRLIAIALMTCFAPAIAQQPSDAQVVESMVGGSACAASVGCGVVVGIVVLGGVAYYVLNAKGRKYRVSPMEVHAQPIPQAGPRPRAFYAQEQHGAASEGSCYKMAQRFQRAGRRVKLVRTERNNLGVGGVLTWKCIFEGEDAQPGWYGS